MDKITYSSLTHKIANGAISISANSQNNPNLISIAIQSGAAVTFYYQNLWSTFSDSSLTTAEETSTKGYIQGLLGYAADGVSYRSWLLEAYNTALATESSSTVNATKYNIYLRFSLATNKALLCFSSTEQKALEWNKKEVECDEYQTQVFDKDGNPVLDEDGNPTYETSTSKWVNDYERLRYVWLQIGELSAVDGGGNRSVTIDLGCLGSDKGLDDKSGDWYSIDASTRKASMKEGWVFGAFKSLTYQFQKLFQPSGAETTEFLGVDYILCSTDTNVEASAVKSTADKTLSTTGWMLGPFFTWLRSKFVRKDNADGTEQMKGSLKSDKDIRADGELGGGTLDVDDDAKIGGDTAIGQDATIGGHADVTGYVKSPVHKSDSYEEGELLGVGVAMWEEKTKINEGTEHESTIVNGYVQTDFLAVRKSAYFRELTIEEVKHIGGEMILSQAAGQVARVAGYDASNNCLFDTAGKLSDNTEQQDGTTPLYYRLFFDSEANGKTQYNEWRVGDQVRCWSAGGLDAAGTYTNVRTAYYWRLVINVVNDTNDENQFYIDVSNTTSTISSITYATKTGTTTLSTSNGLVMGPGCDVGCTCPQPNDSLALLGCRDANYPSRTAAQVYSTAESSSPSRRYYHGITQFSTSCCAVETMEWDTTTKFPHWKVGDDDSYMDFSKEGLNIVAKSIKMSGSDKTIEERLNETEETITSTVNEALADGFSVYNQQTTDDFLYPTPNDYDENEDGEKEYINADMDAYTLSIYQKDNTDTSASDYIEKGNANLVAEVGNYFLTLAGYLFCLVTDESGKFYWHIVTDKYLIDATNTANEAQETANGAVSTLTNMASDNIITAQEKATLRQNWEEVQKEASKMATLYASYDPDSEDDDNPASTEYSVYTTAYNALSAKYTAIGISSNTDYTFANAAARTSYVKVITDYNDAKLALLNRFSEIAEENAKSYTDTEITNKLKTINKMGADGLLTTAELRTLEKEWTRIYVEHTNTLSICSTLGIDASDDSYGTDYQTYVDIWGLARIPRGEEATFNKNCIYYKMSALPASGGLNLAESTSSSFVASTFTSNREIDLSNITDVDTETETAIPFSFTSGGTEYTGANAFNKMFSDYYTAYAKLSQDIAAAQKGYSDAAQETADGATTTLTNMASDNIITKQEKATLRKTLQEMVSEYAKMKSMYDGYTPSEGDNPAASEFSSYQSAYLALKSMYGATIQVNTDSDYTFASDSDKTTYVSDVTTYNSTKLALLNRFSEIAEENAKSYTDSEIAGKMKVINAAGADGILTTAELRTLEKEWSRIYSERSNTVSICTALGISASHATYGTDYTNYIQAYGVPGITNSLTAKLSGAVSSGGLALVSGNAFFASTFTNNRTIDLKNINNSDTDPVEFSFTIGDTTYTAAEAFNKMFSQYYSAYAAIAKDIAAAQKGYSDAAQETADGAKTTAEDAASTAIDAQKWAAMTVDEQITALASDGTIALTPDKMLAAQIASRLASDKKDMDAQWSQLDDAAKANSTYSANHTNYANAYTSLKGILDGWAAITADKTLTDSEKTTLSTAVSTYTSTRALFVSSHGSYINEMGAYKTHLGNLFEYKNGSMQVKEDSGIVTESNYAEMYSTQETTWTDRDGVKHTDTIAASIKAQVDDGMSHVDITADEIDLTGETVVKGILRNGNIIINSDNAANYIKTESNPIAWANGEDSIYMVPLKKLSGITTFDNDWLDNIGDTPYLFLPGYPTHVFRVPYNGLTNGNFAEDTFFTRNTQRYESNENGTGGSNTVYCGWMDTMMVDSWQYYAKKYFNTELAKSVFKETWNSLSLTSATGEIYKSYIRFINRYKASIINEARKWVGTKIQIIMMPGAYLNVLGSIDLNLSSDEQVSIYNCASNVSASVVNPKYYQISNIEYDLNTEDSYGLNSNGEDNSLNHICYGTETKDTDSGDYVATVYTFECKRIFESKHTDSNAVYWHDGVYWTRKESRISANEYVKSALLNNESFDISKFTPDVS